VNLTLVLFFVTFTVAGTVTAGLLLDRLTTTPPVGASEVSVTVQESVPEPVMDAALQESALNACATPWVAPNVAKVKLQINIANSALRQR
jgi:hypothetical protein